MLFKKKKEMKCDNCGDFVSDKSNFCSNCGISFIDLNKEKEDFGLLGKNDSAFMEQENSMPGGFGITDKLVNSIFNSMMKTLNKQFEEEFRSMEREGEKAEIKNLPNGIRIKIFTPRMQQPRKQQAALPKQKLDEKQIERMSGLPREKAKANVKRVGNKVIYELSTPGVVSAEDVFVSKLESGYEIKAIGSKKVYVNSVPINLPLRSYSVGKNKLFIEFRADNNFH